MARTNLLLTHSQATNNNARSKNYQAGYRQGWWHQPAEKSESPEYMEGYYRGWNHRSLDAN